MSTTTMDTAVAVRLRSLLLELARRQHDIAHQEAAATPYWSPTPLSALAHDAAAAALRAEADLLLELA